MQNIKEIIKALPQLLYRNAASATEIASAEKSLVTNFSEEYKICLTEYGAILADGIQINGLKGVVVETEKERQINPNIPRTLYVIENLGIEGIVIWQDHTGAIYKTAPNAAPTKIATSLCDYIQSKI